MKNEITEQPHTAPKTFFHVAALPLAPGSVIEPGNWGRVLRMKRSQEGSYVLLRETIFEQVRRQYFPHLPSRLDCIFLCETANGVLNYMCEHNPTGIAYEVSLQHDDASLFRTCYDLVDITTACPLQESTYAQANAYWRGEGADKSERIEVLATTPVRVVRRIGGIMIHHG